MLGKTTVRLMLLASLSFATASIAAGGPTFLDGVPETARAGSLSEAQGMMDKVLRDHPDSAKAHFEEAELLAKEGQPANAAAELYVAERLAPGLPFENRQTVDSLKDRIASLHPNVFTLGAFVTRVGLAKWVSWAMLFVGVGLIAAIVYLFRSMSRSNASQIAAAGGSGSSKQIYSAGTTAAATMPSGPGFNISNGSSDDDIRVRRRQLE